MARSENAKEMLTEEVREAAGDEAAGRARSELDRGKGRAPRPRTMRAALESNRLLLIVSVVLALTVGVIAALALESWWILVVVMLIHGLASTIVVGLSLRMATDHEKPDPMVEARLEEEGVADPESELDELVERSRGEGEG